MDNIQSYKTLTGLTLEQVAQKLDAELPKDAYKPVPGVADLTDIDPNYMRKILNEVFGVCGFGWGYSYEPNDLVVEVEVRKTKTGGTRRVHVASLKRLRLWYKLGSGNTTHICDVYASGGSDNEVEAYAMSGAITNAIGKAVSNLGFQESVYLGKRNHRTVARKATSTKPAPASKLSVTASKATAVPKAEVNDEIVDDPILATASNPSLDEAAGLVITDKMTKKAERIGQKLGDQSLEVIEWWANKMKPANNEQVKLQANAKVLLKIRSNGHEPVAV